MGHGRDRGRSGEVKVFCFFSSEKKNLSYPYYPFFHFSLCLLIIDRMRLASGCDAATPVPLPAFGVVTCVRAAIFLRPCYSAFVR
jgi:hypothetical protein